MANCEHYYATDMMRFVAGMYRLDWVPQEERNPLSHFTELSEKGVIASIRIWEHNAIMLYQMAHNNRERNFRDFAQPFITNTDIQDGRDFFDVCTAVARFATMYYESGITDAPDVAIELIESVLHQAKEEHGADLYHHFDRYGFHLHVHI